MPPMSLSGASPIHMTARMPTAMMTVVPRSDWVVKMIATGMTMRTNARTSMSLTEDVPSR